MSAAGFRAARDLLLAARDDHDLACRTFRWPQPAYFNWALDWFDTNPAGIALELIDPGGSTLTVSYPELAARSGAVAAWLRDLGVRRGDRVLIVLGTQRELWECQLACLKLGAVVIPTYPSLTPAEARDRLGRGRIRHLICRAGRASVFPDPVPGVRVAVGADVPGWSRYADAFAPARPFEPDGPTPAADIAFGYFTSGTTAAPKLVAHTHASYPIGHLTSMYWNGLRPGDRHLNVAAPGWAKHSWSSLFVPFTAGATLVAVTGEPGPGTLARLLAGRRIDSFCAPPGTWRALAGHLGTARPTLREATSAGEPLDAGLARRVRDAWGVTVRDGYGQTETTALIGTTPGLRPRPGWLGKPLPGVTVHVDETTGEIQVGLDDVGMLAGYLDDEAATAAAFAGGRYHTGDLGVAGDDGWIRIAGRRDDVFKCDGHRVSPYELEAVLRTHPAVADAAVVAHTGPGGGLVPHAVVVAHPGTAADDLSGVLLAHLAERVAPPLRPRAVHVVDALPRTPSGKIRRRELSCSGHTGCPADLEVTR
ncbi:AMP-binding protein [Actinoplanes sp. NPDC023714]|uniref:acyl-CoA synthetase n=1 Tax=Actinoplanes sp. NPDC023714 TaxID=3154322 RepID=UPI0033CB473F